MWNNIVVLVPMEANANQVGSKMRTSLESGSIPSLREVVCCGCLAVLHRLRLRGVVKKKTDSGAHSSTEAEHFPPTDWKMRTPFRHSLLV